MKKQFTLLLVTLLGMLGFAANADISVTFDVSGEGSVSVCSLGTTTEIVKVSQGKTTVTLPGSANSSFTLVPDEDTEIENVENLVYSDCGTVNSNGSWTIDRVYGGDTWTITIKAKSGGDPTPTVKTTILNLLSDANVDVYCSNPWGKTQSLKKGENVVEIPNRSYYIAALGVTNQSNLIVKANGEGNPLYVYGSAPFDSGNGVSVLFNSATAADSYTIEVVGGTVVPETYSFDVTLTGKAAVKYQNGSPTWEVVNLTAGTNKVSIPKAVSAFYFVPRDDYTLESCDDSKGNALSTVNSFSIGTTYKIETASLADGYILVTKAPAVKTIVLDVLTADADIVLFNKISWTKEKNLVAGENTVEIPAAAYYIVANGIKNPARLIVKDPDGQELPVKDYNNLTTVTSGVNVLFESATAPAKYTIEVKEEAPVPTVTTFTLNIDNINKVFVYHPIPSLVNGENLLDPIKYPTIQIQSQSSKPIYKCTLNGEPVEPDVLGGYTVKPTKAGQVIDVVTEWPDEKYTIELAYTNAQGVWTSATVATPNGTIPLEIVDNKIEVEAGSLVDLYCDEIGKYTLKPTSAVIGLDGKSLTAHTYSGVHNVTFNAIKSGTITTTATIEIPVSINIDGNPDDVQVKYAASGSSPWVYQIIPDLEEGANTFTLQSGDDIRIRPLNNTTITVTYKAAGDADTKEGINSEGTFYTEPFTGLGAELNITVTGGANPVYDKEFVVNLDGFCGKLMYRPIDGGYELFRRLEAGHNAVSLTTEEQNLIGGLLYIVPADGWDFTECTDGEGNEIKILSSNAFPSYVDVNTYNPRREYYFKGVSNNQGNVAENVSTEPQPRVAVLEILDGFKVPAAIDAQNIAAQIKAKYPKRFIPIKLHSGCYAVPGRTEPDYRTDYTIELNTFLSPQGYPMGSINRTPGSDMSSLCIRRDKWADQVREIINTTSPVNVWAEANVDSETRELTVNVEGFFTSDMSADKIGINVWLLQDKVLGPQSGGDMGDEYVHNNMFRHNITPTWGDMINGKANGESFTDTYRYIVPEAYREVPCDLENISVVVAITADDENHTIITACKALGIGSEDLPAANFIGDAEMLEIGCGDEATLRLSLGRADEINGFQTDITFPEGLSIAQNSRGKLNVTLGEGTALKSHSLTAQKVSGDNRYRVLVYSSKSETFTSGEGLLNIPLVSDDSFAGGEIVIDNTELNFAADYTEKPGEVRIPVNLMLYGDANDNGRVAIDDIVAEVLYIMENDPQPFSLKKADVNRDGSISIADVMKTVGIVLSNSNTTPVMNIVASTVVSRDGSSPLSLGEVNFVDGKAVLTISLGDIDDITALQGELSLPEGVKVTDITLADAQVDRDHNVDYRELNATDVRFAVYSLSLDTLEPDAQLLDVELSCADNFAGGNLTLSDIMLTDTKAQAQEFGKIEIAVPDPGVATGIKTVGANNDYSGSNVYNTQGVLLMRNASNKDIRMLREGIYILQRADSINKIIVK